MSERVFAFGPFRLDAGKAVVWRDGEVLPLTPKALALLQVLVETGGDLVTKADQLVPRGHDMRPWARQIGTRYRDLFSVEDHRAEEIAVQLHARLRPAREGLVRFALGERDGALDELERAADVRDPWIVLLAADAAFAELHGDARFQGLVERVHGRA